MYFKEKYFKELKSKKFSGNIYYGKNNKGFQRNGFWGQNYNGFDGKAFKRKKIKWI